MNIPTDVAVYYQYLCGKPATAGKNPMVFEPGQETALIKRNPPYVKDIMKDKFGDVKLYSSQWDAKRNWGSLYELDESFINQERWFRCRVHSVRSKVLREGFLNMQGVIDGSVEGGDIVEYASTVPAESVIDVYAAEREVQSCTISKLELQISKLITVAVAACRLPFQLQSIEQSIRREVRERVEREKEIEAIGEEKKDEPNKEEPQQKQQQPKKKKKDIYVSLDKRLDRRYLDMRVPVLQAIFRVQSGVARFFRAFFLSKNFTEIHSPKMISAASEGGANVFKLKYFNRSAFLAQSPQFYKQMAIAGDFGGVFEIGPVFRAEDSNTPRHLCEFTGLDFEMAFKDHYHEVVNTLGNVFVFVFDNLKKYYGRELALIKKFFPSPQIEYPKKTLVLSFKECVDMLLVEQQKLVKMGKTKEEIFLYGAEVDHFKDFNTPNEKLLGKLIKKKHGTDFYIVDKYPLAARPFYTMPCPHDGRYSNSYDVFLRGEEITSGAQRVHDFELLTKQLIKAEVPLHTVRDYIDAFKWGAPPHGGAGIGLERVVMLYCGLGNIRFASLFPRDPKRLTP